MASQEDQYRIAFNDGTIGSVFITCRSFEEAGYNAMFLQGLNFAKVVEIENCKTRSAHRYEDIHRKQFSSK